MDVVLGVAVTGPLARLSLVGPAARGYAVLDESVVDVAMQPIETLIQTVVGTNQLLAGENHRLVATRLCWSDAGKADELRRALEDSGVHDVTLVSESEAATALVHTTPPGSAAQLVGNETATLTTLGADDAPPTVLAAQALEGTDDGFAIARGAALAAESPMTAAAAMLPEDHTTMAPTAGLTQSSPQEEPQLAYSLADDSDLLPFDGLDEPEDDETEAGPSVYSTRSFLISYVVIVFAVIGFSTLAVAVAIAVRPAASQQPVQGHQNATPGKFMPLLPTQQQAPVPPPPVDAPTAGFQGGSIPVAPAPAPQPATPPIAPEVPVAPPAPAPGGGPVPVPMPMPVPVPIFVPPVIPLPIPQPNPPQPITPTTAPPPPTTTTPPTTVPTTTTPPTTVPTTTTPPTTVPTTTTPPTTVAPTTTPPTTVAPTTAVPTTVAPTTAAPTTAAPTTAAPVTTAAPPVTTRAAQTTVAPAPTHTQPPAAPTRRIPGS